MGLNHHFRGFKSLASAGWAKRGYLCATPSLAKCEGGGLLAYIIVVHPLLMFGDLSGILAPNHRSRISVLYPVELRDQEYLP
jgi:hypothetical protein